MAVRLGMDCVLYRNTGTYGVPTWNEIPNVRDATLTLETAVADVTTRGNNGWRAEVATLKTATVEFEMVWDTADDDFQAFLDAYLNNTSIEVAVMDDLITTTGAEGLRATMMVTRCDRTEPLEDAAKASVTIKPTYAANAPEWLVI